MQMPSLGRTVRHVRNPSDVGDYPSNRDEAMDDLGTSRRILISTTDMGKGKSNARELSRLEREQRVNPGRQLAMDNGWLSVEPDSDIPGDQLEDIAGGQTHRVNLERSQRADDIHDYAGGSNDARNMASISRSANGPTRQLPNTTARSFGNGRSGLRPVQPPRRGTHAFQNLTPPGRGDGFMEPHSPTPLGTIDFSGGDPARDPARGTWMGRMTPGPNPQPVMSGKKSGKKKSKFSKGPPTRPHPQSSFPVASNGPPPNLLPMFASGSLAVNPPPLPVDLVSDSKVGDFLRKLWAGIDDKPSAMVASMPPEFVPAVQIPTPERPTVADSEVYGTPSESTESSGDESGDCDSEVTEWEEVYTKFSTQDLCEHDVVDQRQDVMHVDDTPSTTPEPRTPIATITDPTLDKVVTISSPSLINDEPNHAEIARLPTAMLDLTQRLIEAQVQPVGHGSSEEHRQALASVEDYDDWFVRNRAATAAATHKPVTNSSQYIAPPYRSKEVMKSKFAD